MKSFILIAAFIFVGEVSLANSCPTALNDCMINCRDNHSNDVNDYKSCMKSCRNDYENCLDSK